MNYTEVLKARCKELNLNYVGIRGNPFAPICVIGEAPDDEENKSGLPFVGASGKEQDRMLHEAGIAPNEVWFTNPYKVQPPNNDLSLLETRGIPLDLYENQFYEELRQYKPTIIICAGATAMKLLCPQTGKRRGQKIEFLIGKWRGSILTSPSHILTWSHYVIPVQHPAYIFREWSERQISVMIYEKAKEEYEYMRKFGRLQPLPERQFLLAPKFPTLYEFLTPLIEKRTRISVDVELLWQRQNKALNLKSERLLYTIAIAPSPYLATSFCLWDYTETETAQLFGLLSQLLRNCPQIGQNYLAFDCHWLGTVGLRPNVNLVDDTLVRHHVLWIELPHKLDFQAMHLTREPYWKDEAHHWYVGADKFALLRYNCKDAAVTYEIFLAQDEEMQC